MEARRLTAGLGPSRTWFTAALLLLIACQSREKRVIAVIPKSTAHLFWVSVRAGARKAAREAGVQLLWNGPPQETDYSRQIAIVDSMIARHVNGLALAAAEREALVQPLDRAAAAGIPVTVFDSGVNSTNYLSFVATDNYEAGQTAARSLGGLLNGKGKVAMVMHAPGSASTMDRERGFTDAIGKEFPEIAIVQSLYGEGDRAKAVAATENILTAHPDLNGLFASAEPGSMGASLTLKSRGLSGKVKLVAFDSSADMIEDLKGGTIDAMVVQDPYRMGYEAVMTLVDKLNGKTPQKRINLKARVIRKAELATPEVRQLLSPDLQEPQ